MSRPQRVSRAKRKQHEALVISARQVARLKRSGGERAESTPEDYEGLVTDAEMGRVRRAIEIRKEERELAEALKPGWAD